MLPFPFTQDFYNRTIKNSQLHFEFLKDIDILNYLAISLYSAGPKAYRLTIKKYQFPDVSTLRD